MSYRYARNMPALLLMMAAVAAFAQTAKPTVVRKEVSLKFGGATMTAVKLENMHGRSYQDPGSGNQCGLTNTAEGVLWKITCEGDNISVKDVSAQDEQGRKFQRTCWNTQGTVYEIDAKGKRTGGGPRTEFMAFGPEDSKSVRITFGDVSAEIALPQSIETAGTKAAIGYRILDDREFFTADFAKSVRSTAAGKGAVVPAPCPEAAKIHLKYGKPDKVELETVSIENGPTVMLAVHYYGDLGLGVANEVVMAVLKKK